MLGDFSHVAVDWNNNCPVDSTTIVSTEVISGEFRKIVFSKTFPSPDSLYENTKGRSQCRHGHACPAHQHAHSVLCE